MATMTSAHHLEAARLRLSGLIDAFRTCNDDKDTAKALNAILKEIEVGETMADSCIVLSAYRDKLISYAKSHVYSARWNRKGVHPILFGRILDLSKRGQICVASACTIQRCVCKWLGRRTLALQLKARKTGIMMARNSKKQGKSGRYVDYDGADYFFGVDANGQWWQILTETEWENHIASGSSSGLVGTSVMVLLGEWNSNEEKVERASTPVTFGDRRLCYWQISSVKNGTDSYTPNERKLIGAYISESGVWCVGQPGI